MARIKLKYATPRVFNIDESRRRVRPLSAEIGVYACDIISITFSESLYSYSVPLPSAFTIALSGGATVVDTITVFGGAGVVFLNLDRSVLLWETGTVTYTPGVGPLQSADRSRDVDNFVADVTIASSCTTTSTTTTEGFVDVKYGYLYNWYAVTDARNIANTGWHVPIDTEFDTLSTYLGGNSVSGGKLKETGTVYWNTPNTGATNEVGFNARGGGARTNLGVFSLLMSGGEFFTSSLYNATDYYRIELTSSNDNYYRLNTKFAVGSYIRLLKDTTTLTHGQTGTYTGNDGTVYRTICIGTQEWLADNLCETLYRDLSLIPEVTNNATWAALITGARCSYNNDESNAFE